MNSSEATGPIWTKLWWNGPWMAPFQNCVRWSRLPTKMAAKLKIEKRGDEILIVHCCFSVSQNELKFHPPFFLFWAWRPSWLEVGITRHIFERGPSKDHSTKVWLQLVQWFLRRRLKCEMLTDGWRTKSDDNSSHGLKARWAKKGSNWLFNPKISLKEYIKLLYFQYKKYHNKFNW